MENQNGLHDRSDLEDLLQQADRQQNHTPVKHTPGPWAISGPWDENSIPDDVRIVAPNYGARQYVADVHTGQAEMWRQQAFANVRLIAAAPGLFDALVNLQRQIRAIIKFDVKKHYSLMVADAAASKAIAKAEGRL